MQSLKAKNALVNSVYYVTRYTIYNLVFSFHLFNITPVVECINIKHFFHCFLKKKKKPHIFLATFGISNTA